MNIQITTRLQNHPFTAHLDTFTYEKQQQDILLTSKENANQIQLIYRTAQQLTQNNNEILPLIKSSNYIIIVSYTTQTSILIDEITLLYSKFASQIPSFSHQQTAQIITSFARYFNNQEAIFSLTSAKELQICAGECLKTLINERQAKNFIGKSLRDMARMSLDGVSKLSQMSVLSAKQLEAGLDGGDGKGDQQ